MAFIKYFKSIYKQYGIINFLLAVATLLSIIIAIDYFNLFTFIYDKLKLPIIICILSFVLIKIFSLKLHSLILLKSVNYVDFYSMITIITIVFYKIFLSLFENILSINQFKDIFSNLLLVIIGCLLFFRCRIYSYW